MRKKGERFVLSNEQKLAHNRLVSALKNAIRSEGISITELGIISDVPFAPLKAFLDKGRPMTSFSLIKLADMLGFDISFVKRSDGVMIKDNPVAQARILAQREKMKNMPSNKSIKKPKILKVQKKNDSNEANYLIAQSRKKQIEQHEEGDNFLN